MVGKMERVGDGSYIKKGPWTSDEDEVLIKFVNKYGPRDWSSIRSMGLLPRTGKSCRLRWVNKLRPNLKTGCKFSADEERIVIELQGQFGNKWAKIATYLSGRTDNDVKNFWSSRRKRLERILNIKSNKNKGKNTKHEILQGSSSSSTDQARDLSNFGNITEDMLTLPEMMKQDFLNYDTIPPPPGSESMSYNPFLNFPQHPLDLSIWTECDKLDKLVPDPGLDMFDCQNASECQIQPDFLTRGDEQKGGLIPDSLFDEFPADMFD